MNCINNPALFAGFFAVGMDFVMARAAERGKQAILAKVATIAPRFVMDVLAFGFLATLANRVEGQIRILDLCILLVFTLALGGCIPQPSAAFQWSF
jgi:hypothetical protein